MRLKNALTVSFSCWKVMLKSMFVQLLIFAVVLSVAVLGFSGLVTQIVGLADEIDLGGFVTSSWNDISAGTFNLTAFAEALEEKIDAFKAGIEAIPNVFNRLEFSYVMLILGVCLYRMMVSATDVAAGCEINEFMTSNSSRPFSWYFFRRIDVSLKFTALQFALTFPLDLVVMFASVGFAMMFLITMSWWAIFPGLVIVLLLYSLRQTLFAFWLPSITADNLPVTKALRNGLSTVMYGFWSVFWKNFLIVSVMQTASIALTVFLPNSPVGVVLSATLTFFLFFIMKCVNMVEYFETTQKPYFAKPILIEGTERYNKKMKTSQN